MELKQPAQYYWTTLFDQYQPQSLSFAFVPLRSFTNNEIPRLDVIARVLDAQSLGSQQIQPWHIPALLACLLPGYGPLQSPFELMTQLTSGSPIMIHPYKLGFAQYIAHSDVIPFEESPLKGKSLMSIAGSAGVTIGLLAAGGTPMVIVTVPLGILLCTAAAELGPELGKRLPKLMGLTR
jgi:hypothetical protein